MNDIYIAAVDSMRRDKDDAFRNDPGSPIEDPESFPGLAYYPVDPAYRIPTRLRRHAVAKSLTMETSDGQTRVYRNVGEFQLKIPEGEVRIQAYQRDDDAHELFVPFRDATSGKETYGAGRYLDLQPEGEPDAFVVDFNLAYNPMCAYNEAFSCPFPPPENWLKVPIRAGERAYEAG